MQSFLIAGLGNVGEEYDHTRHNIGFDVVDAYCRKYNGTFRLERHAWVAEVKVKGRKVTLLKPTTYMNLSGKAVKYWLDKQKVNVANSITVVDDLALPLEKLRIRPSGSHAGHNGLSDIQAALGTDAYPKLRFGIGNDFKKGRQVEYVLGKWAPNEFPVVVVKIDACVQALDAFVLEGLDAAMNRFNKLNFE